MIEGTQPAAALPISDAKMVKFVKDLFLNVLGIKDPPAAWMDSWFKRAVAVGDPLELFDQFVASNANIERLNRNEDTATLWPTGHFYSPVVSREEAKAEWSRLTRPHEPAAVDLQFENQGALLSRLANFFDSVPFQDNKNDVHRYYFNNNSYGFGDALIFWSMLNCFRPRKIIEVGCGFSSALALDTIDAIGLSTVCTFIDPFPKLAEAVTAPMSPRHSVHPIKIQELDLEQLRTLERDDILFVDSSHVVKTGSDVHFEITEMLPQLRPGVLVHFHDIFYPFEYRKKWAIDLNRSWNEVYFLHAFLMYNRDFRIEFFNDFVAQKLTAAVHRLAPAQAQRFLLNPGGGLWLRRV